MKKSTILAAIMALSTSTITNANNDNFNYNVDRFADIEVIRYQVPGFDQLSLNQKKLIYYLSQAALQGRDILFDQNGKYNLEIRQILENIYTNFNGDRNSKEFKAFGEYLKQVWFANGIYHHYSNDKFIPKFTKGWFSKQFQTVNLESLGINPENKSKYIAEITKVIFDKKYLSKKVNQAVGSDLVATSAVNFYEGVTQKEVEDYFEKIKNANDEEPISYGLNTKIVKKDGVIEELPYKIGGLYSNAIGEIIYWLSKAKAIAENETQKKTIQQLIEFYITGDLRTFDEYSITWVTDTESRVDFINGFIESYNDPLGMTGSWESIVNFKNEEASHRTEVLSTNAKWFEDHSPVDPRFRRDKVKGVSAKVITACILAGDSYPATPIGINLPNANWIRAIHGSKSVTLENITDAYDKASQGNGFNDEFVLNQSDRELLEKYLFITDNLHTDLHECLGHGSGKLLPGVDPDALKAHGSTLEETRADLFALYYLADPKLIELGLLDNKDAYKAEYYKYILNGLMTQLMRIEPGKDIEEAHMRNRKLIAEWVYEKGTPDKVIEYVKHNGKTYIQINDYEKLRTLFGELLKEIQRIKSEGDYKAGEALVEKYAVKVDSKLHKEVLDRYEHLNIAPYKGFVNPIYKPIFDENGNIVDITLDYTEGYIAQMLRLSKDYSPLTKK